MVIVGHSDNNPLIFMSRTVGRSSVEMIDENCGLHSPSGPTIPAEIQRENIAARALLARVGHFVQPHLRATGDKWAGWEWLDRITRKDG